MSSFEQFIIPGRFERQGAVSRALQPRNRGDGTATAMAINLSYGWTGTISLTSGTDGITFGTVEATFTAGGTYDFTTPSLSRVYRLEATALTIPSPQVATAFPIFELFNNEILDVHGSAPTGPLIPAMARKGGGGGGAGGSVTLSGGGTSSQTATAKGFAPGATVTFYKNGSSAGTATANVAGVATFSLTLANNDVVVATGLLSSTSAKASVNTSGSLMPLYAAALANTRNGVSKTRIVMIGDSTTAGAYGGDDGSATSGNGRNNSVPMKIQAAFQASGLPNMGKNLFGNPFTQISTIALLQAHYNDLYYETNWVVTNAGGGNTQGPGGFMIDNTTNAVAQIGFNSVYDTFEVLYPVNTTLDSNVSVMINGSLAGTINQVGSKGWAYGQYSGTAGTTYLRKNADSLNSYIQGFAAYNAANKGVQVFNTGWGGSTTTQWAQTNGGVVFGPIEALQVMNADLWTICLGINDWQNSISLSTYQANLQTLINTLKARGGDVMLIGTNRTDPAIGFSQTIQESYVAACASVAATNNLKYFDIASLPNFDTYANASAAGYMGDQRHPNKAGYAVIANALYAILNNP